MTNELLFWLLMPYVFTFGFVVGFMSAPLYVAPVSTGYYPRPLGGWR